MITLQDDNGTEVTLSESKARPGATLVTIIAPSFDAVQKVIWDLAVEWSCIEFTLPTQCGERWGAVGAVSNGG